MNTNVVRTVAAAALLAVVSAGTAAAQQPAAKQPAPKAAAAKSEAAPKQAAAKPKQAAAKPKHETQKALRAEAKIKEDSARKVALAQVPNGKVTKHELERENGKVVYSYDIKVQGKTGRDEVLVDAVTGAVVSNTHESPAAEKKETTKAKAPAKKG